MDTDHNIIITPKGQYQYDPDFDIYRRVPEPGDQTHWQRYGWIYVFAVLLAITVIFLDK